jgi:NTE family protein
VAGRTPRTISLALQGGGAHGAFEWGVIDRLLECEDLEIRAATGASAGAMNAVCLASGLAEGGREGARKSLEKFWKGVSHADGRNVLGSVGSAFTAMMSPAWLRDTPGWRMAEASLASFSPYEFNPLGLNPLHDVLEAAVNFRAVRERSPIHLFIAATAVRTGKLAVFEGPELTARHVMASACLPTVFHAVEIDGEPYWDGGYLANPPLWPLFYDDTPDDILIVSLNPFRRPVLPKAPGEIMDRLNEISFNATLASELRAIAFVQKLIDQDMLKPKARNRYRRMLVHGIGADGALDDLSLASKSDTDWLFLRGLRDRGRKAAEAWLAQDFEAVGVRSSLDLTAFL